MSDIQQNTSVSRPRWDGSRVLFEIEDAGQHISCAISRGALQDLSERRYFKSTELLRCFAEARGRIEAIARSKLRASPESASGVISIWADDVDEAPAESA
jgi:hypothetical protein